MCWQRIDKKITHFNITQIRQSEAGGLIAN